MKGSRAQSSVKDQLDDALAIWYAVWFRTALVTMCHLSALVKPCLSDLVSATPLVVAIGSAEESWNIMVA